MILLLGACKKSDNLLLNTEELSFDQTQKEISDLTQSSSKASGLEEALKYQTELYVYDEEKENYVLYNVSSDDEDYLNQFIQSHVLSLHIIKEIPKDSGNNLSIAKGKEGSEDDEIQHAIVFIPIEENIPDGALGYEVNINKKDSRYSSGPGPEPGYTNMIQFQSALNGAIVINNSNLPGLVEVWVKPSLFGLWQLGFVNILNPTGMANFYKVSYKLRVQINYNLGASNYTVGFYN